MLDLHTSLDAQVALVPIEGVGGNADGSWIDLSGAMSLDIHIVVGFGTLGGANTFDIVIQESNETGHADASTVADDDLIGSARVIDTVNSVVRVGYRGHGNRWVRLQVVHNGAAAADLAAIAVLGHLSRDVID